MRQKSGKYFEVVVAFEKMGEDGLTKKTKETVVVEAFNLSEAEQRALEEYAPLAVGAPECVKAGLASYKEIFFADEGDIFYKARVALITINESNDKERRTNVYYLTNAPTIEAARKNIVDAYKNSTADYVIANLGETKIVEVYEKK